MNNFSTKFNRKVYSSKSSHWPDLCCVTFEFKTFSVWLLGNLDFDFQLSTFFFCLDPKKNHEEWEKKSRKNELNACGIIYFIFFFSFSVLNLFLACKLSTLNKRNGIFRIRISRYIYFKRITIPNQNIPEKVCSDPKSYIHSCWVRYTRYHDKAWEKGAQWEIYAK